MDEDLAMGVPAGGVAADPVGEHLGGEKEVLEQEAAKDKNALDEKVKELQLLAEELRGRIGQMEAEAQQRQESVNTLRDQLGEAVSKYREAMLAADPLLPGELLVGGSIAELETAAVQAQEVVSKVRRQLAAQVEENRVPAGAPGRGQPDLSRLSPREKIKAGLGG